MRRFLLCTALLGFVGCDEDGSFDLTEDLKVTNTEIDEVTAQASAFYEQLRVADTDALNRLALEAEELPSDVAMRIVGMIDQSFGRSTGPIAYLTFVSSESQRCSDSWVEWSGSDYDGKLYYYGHYQQFYVTNLVQYYVMRLGFPEGITYDYWGSGTVATVGAPLVDSSSTAMEGFAWVLCNGSGWVLSTVGWVFFPSAVYAL